MFTRKRVLLACAVVLVGLQLVPYGRDHSNPPVVGEPQWSSPRVRELAKRACFDCHSNETVWPWYAHLAPVSWLVQRDVDEGREHLNFSTFTSDPRDADEAAELAESGEMPPWFYLPLHAEARLSEAETRELVDGLTATLGGKGANSGPGERHEEHEEHR